jgi:prepilin-type N-terminal cleavage/methylation domain-containing protein
MKRSSGFTLLELMTTVVIVGILAIVAMPAYKQYVIKAKIAEAYVYLDEVAKNQVSGFYDLNRFLTFSELFNSANVAVNIPEAEQPPEPTGEGIDFDPRLAATVRGGDSGRDTGGDNGRDTGRDTGGDDEPSASAEQPQSFNTVVHIGKTTSTGADCSPGTCGGVGYTNSTGEYAILRSSSADGSPCTAGMNAQQVLGNSLVANHDWTTLASIGDLDLKSGNFRCTTIFRTIQASPLTNRVPKISPFVELFVGN